MNDCTIKKNCSLSEKMITSVIDVVKDSGYKEIYYLGTCNEKLITNLAKMEGSKIYMNLHNACDETYSTFKYYDDKKQCYIDEEDFDEYTTWMFPIHKNIISMGEGMPRSDILLLDVVPPEKHYVHSGYSMFPDDNKYGEHGIPKIVILFGEANMESFYDRNFYNWRSDDHVLIGVLRDGVEVDFDSISFGFILKNTQQE